MPPSESVPALSLIQPWPLAICRLGKRIENRTAWRACRYRGPIWLHASATRGRAFHEACIGLDDALAQARRGTEWDRVCAPHLEAKPTRNGVRWIPRPTLPMGAIVGRARIDGVLYDERDFAAWCANGADVRQRAWWFGGFALVLADVVEIEPVPCKGALGLWRVPEEIEARAHAAWINARAA